MDVVTEFARGCAGELLYADDLVMMSETIERLGNLFFKWKVDFEGKGLKVNFGKTKFSGGITEDGMSRGKVDPCRVCSLRVKTNSVWCLQCGKWIYGRCAGTPMFSRNCTCRKCEGNIGKAV